VETEIREMLRQKAGEAFAPITIPVSTAARAKRRRVLTGAGLGVGLAAAIVAIIAGVGAITGQHAIDFTTPIEPKRTLEIDVGRSPATLATGFGSVWASAGDEIVRIDARSGKVVALIETIGKPRTSGGFTERDVFTVGFDSFGAGEGAMWIVAKKSGGTFSGQASAIPQPQTTVRPSESAGQQQGTFTLEAQPISPGTPSAFASTGASPPGTFEATSQIFVDSYSLFRIDARTNTLKEVAQFETPGRPAGLAVGEGAVWVVTEDMGPPGGTLWRFDGRTGKREGRIAIQGSPMGVAVQGGSVWVPAIPGPRGEFVLRIDTKANEIVGRVAIPDATFVRSIAAADDDVWVAGGYGVEGAGPFFVARIDARTGRLSGTIEVPENLAKLAAGGGSVWGIPQDGPRSLVRITGNVFSGRLAVEQNPAGLTVDGSRLWLGGVPEGSYVTRYEF
jgi:hypothetical protein